MPGPPSADDFVVRVQQQVARFAETHDLAHAKVEVELRDGARLLLGSLSPEPGYGFVTLRPHPQREGEQEEVIVPLAAIAQIRVTSTDEEPRFGFVLPDEGSSRPAP